MHLSVERVELKSVERMRDLFRKEANCQIVHDSFLSRGLADPYLILVDGRIGGYGAVANKYDKDRLEEFYTVPSMRGIASRMCRELLDVSGATSIGAQTNMPLMLMMLYDFTTNITTENLLFHDGITTHLTCPNSVFRKSDPTKSCTVFGDEHEGEDEWVVELNGAVAAKGSFLCHYNPPYGDVYMEVAADMRQKGIGSYLVQELKRVCYEGGRQPSARCNPTNTASRRTLEKAGLLLCARNLAGEVV